ncbi:phosphoenolpyruvate synthase/pyruvate phosphate dikinase [Rhodococcus sp. 27YEA15]|uniref:PEP/pyruvate-binding domain-containing protein n=1 Tax=Rhodococcus sp. 27YEA15 TaxID=3156259 RepID=UPI003C7A396E
MFLLTNDQVAAKDARNIGGKAMGLARLREAGATVPRWTVIGADAFAAHLTRGDIPELRRVLEATADLADCVGPAERLRQAIVDTAVDPVLAEEVAEVVAHLDHVAVRSSALGEDGAKRSYAGIYETYLFRSGADQVLESIRRCWASAFGMRALHYRRDLDDGALVTDVAVIIQEMVAGDVSGVLFTSNPVTGVPDEAILSACWGLGEGVVSGACAVDEFVLTHGGVEVSSTIADKDIEFVRAESGGVVERPVELGRRLQRCLEPAQATALVREGVRIAAELGAPQDIEWTLRGGEIVMLQTRPITARPTAPDHAPLGSWRTVWDNSNVQESFNGVTTALTFSWAAKVYEVIFREDVTHDRSSRTFGAT